MKITRKPLTILTLMLIFGFAFAPYANAQAEYYPVPEQKVFGEPASQKEVKAIDHLMAQFRRAWANENAAAVAAIHADNVEWINAFGRTFRSAEKLEKFLSENLFPAFDSVIAKREMQSYREISRRYIGSDVVVINAQLDSGRGSSVGNGKRRVSLNFVLAKIDGEWKIVQEVITDIREKR